MLHFKHNPSLQKEDLVDYQELKMIQLESRVLQLPSSLQTTKLGRQSNVEYMFNEQVRTRNRRQRYL